MSGATTIGVIGAGAWGTALAQVAAIATGQTVQLWMRDAAHAIAVNRAHANEAKLPGVTLSPLVIATADPADLADCGIVLLATPAQSMREALLRFQPYLGKGTRAVVTAKGIERTTGKFMVDCLLDVCPDLEPLVLSGPSFAADVARGLPTAVTLAGRTIECVRPVADALSVPSFRPYLSDDLIGVQVGGAVKNVLAIACGIVTGRQLGDSARAALIARSFAELTRFGRTLGARAETVSGLSGLGDLVLSCSCMQSRNFKLGVELGRGRALADILAGQRGISEGAFTAAVMIDLAGRHGIDVPIATAVNDVLTSRASIDDVIERLLQRPLKEED